MSVIRISRNGNRHMYGAGVGPIAAWEVLAEFRAGKQVQITCTKTRQDVTAETLIMAWFLEAKRERKLTMEHFKKLIAA